MEEGRTKAISWRALTLFGALVVICLVFLVTTRGTFGSPRNLALLARQMSVTSLLAVGMVMVIVTGQIDLSVGAMAGLLAPRRTRTIATYGVHALDGTREEYAIERESRDSVR